MIDLDSYEAQAEEGELHVRQIIDVIRELRECRAERDAAIARAERAEAQRDSARRDANGAAHRGDMACARADAAEAQRDALQRHFDAAGPEHNLLALLDHYMELADAAEALAASRLEATEESEATLRGLLIGSHFYVQGGEYGDETFPRAEDARARAAELLTIERNRDVDNCVAWGVMITLGEEDAMGTAIEDADLDTVPALRAHAAKVSR